MHAIIIDDDPVTRLMLHDELEAVGISSDMAGDAESGMKLVREKKPDLCLVDWVMPGAFGTALVQAVRNDPELADTYLIMVTAMTRVEELAVAFWAGVDDYICKPIQKIELASRVRAATRLIENRRLLANHVREVNHLNTLMREANDKLHYLATTDGLTQLSNRTSVYENLAKAWGQWQRYQTPLHIALLDADHFKQVNDQYGHAVGDAVLKQIASTLSEQTRESDFTGRFGGEEFIVGMPQLSTDGAQEAAERLRAEIDANPVVVDGRPIQVTVSIGLASAGPETQSLDQLIREADEALYTAKGAGRNRVCMRYDNHRIAYGSEEAA